VKIFVLLLVAMLFLAPAIRLLLAAQRTRQMPELWAALYFVGAGVGLPLRLYGSSIYESDPTLAATVNVMGHLFFGAGVIAMTVFTWRVFHPGSAHARRFATVTIASILATTVYILVARQGSHETSWAMIATNAARLVPTYWAFSESFKYWGAMKKRAALGIGDPIVANRFLLWAIWTAAVSVLPSASLSLRFLEKVASTLGTDVVFQEVAPPVFLGLRLLFLLVAPIAVGALSLSFFPPTAYLDAVRARADRSSAAESA
jgi:hypothetical protein